MLRLSLVMLLLFSCVGSVVATEEFAAQTRHDCSYCHIDPAGGGD